MFWADVWQALTPKANGLQSPCPTSYLIPEGVERRGHSEGGHAGKAFGLAT